MKGSLPSFLEFFGLLSTPINTTIMDKYFPPVNHSSLIPNGWQLQAYEALHHSEMHEAWCELPRPSGRGSPLEEIDCDVENLVPLVNSVPQQLLNFMNDEHLKQFQSILSGEVPIPSCIDNAYDDCRELTCPDSDCIDHGGLWTISQETMHHVR
jgi:hypothetical protein